MYSTMPSIGRRFIDHAASQACRVYDPGTWTSTAQRNHQMITTAQETQRIPTGIDGLDSVLHGGYHPKSCVMIAGDTGTGKTTLALQFLIEHQNGSDTPAGLYVSVSQNRAFLQAIIDSHGWRRDDARFDIMDLQDFNLHDGESTVFKPDLTELADASKRIIERAQQCQASVVVLDTLSEMRLMAEDELRFRRALMYLKQRLTAIGATVLILTDATEMEREETVRNAADTVLILDHLPMPFGEDLRRLRVNKLRAGTFLGGYHDMRIRTGGIRVYPRLVPHDETYQDKPPARTSPFPTGNADLDDMLDGGFDRSARALTFGPTGIGKSTLGYQLAIKAAERGEHSLLWSFEELPHLIRPRLQQMTDDPAVLDRIHIHHMEQRMMSPGEFSRTVLDQVQDHGISLVILDSITGLMRAIPDHEISTHHLHDLLTFLTSHEVMVYMTMPLAGPRTTAKQEEMLALVADTIIGMQQCQDEQGIGRCLFINKRRCGPHRRHVRRFTIDRQGMVIGKPLNDIAALWQNPMLGFMDDED